LLEGRDIPLLTVTGTVHSDVTIPEL